MSHFHFELEQKNQGLQRIFGLQGLPCDTQNFKTAEIAGTTRTSGSHARGAPLDRSGFMATAQQT